MTLYARLIVVGIAVLIAASWTAAPAGAATLSLEVTPIVTDTPNDGVIGPGDELGITVRVKNKDATNATAPLQGTLTSSAGATVTQGSSDYPTIAPGATAPNDTLFKATVDKALVCGTRLNFNLSLTDGTDTADLPFSIDTGHGQTDLTDYVGSPKQIGFLGTQLRPQLPLAATSYQATASVDTPGIVQSVQVKIGHLTHENIGHLTINLVDPASTRVTLVNQRGAAGQDFTNTELATGAAPLPASDPHYTGTFAPDGPLTAFQGHNQQGDWHLEINEPDQSAIGQLHDWTLNIATTDCTARSFADLQFQPADRVDPGTSVTLDASQSKSAKGVISEYDWDFGSGSFTQDTSMVTRPFPTHGNYAIRVEVSDAGGVIGTATKHLIVSKAPTAVIGPIGSPKQDANIELDASGSSDDEDGPNLASYDWDLNDDGMFNDATGPDPVVKFHTPGSHTIKLRVTDHDGAIATSLRVTFTVTPSLAPSAVVAATPNPAEVGAPVTFDASRSSDSDGNIVAYDWDLDGNGTFETPGASPSRSYPNAGVVNVGLRVTDNDGKSSVTHLAVLIRAAGGGAPGGTTGAAPPAAGGGKGTGAGGPAAGAGGGGPVATGALAASLAGPSIQKLKLVTKKGLGLRCSVDRAAKCSVTVTLKAGDARRLKLSKSRTKAFVLGGASVRLEQAGAATITVHLARSARTKLAKARRLSVRVTGTAVDSGGGRAVLRRVVLLRR
jgi:subtilisin-like proprotein convertase family protein/PKD repeat protein